MRVVIIGSGVAGLAAAIRLRATGWEVTVLEAATQPGGKVGEHVHGGYRFDRGPSLFTMPHLVDELFTLAGEDAREHFNYTRWSEACRYFWEDGKHLYAPGDVVAFAAEAAQSLSASEGDVLRYLSRIRTTYHKSARIFLEKSLHRLSTWLSTDTLRALAHLGSYNLFSTMHRANAHHLKEPHLVQLFDRFATYNGSDPYRAPGILNVIPWLEHGYGTFFPVGGMMAIPRSLHALALRMGVVFHCNTKAERMEVRNGRVVAVRTDNGTFETDIAVSNADVYHTWKHLLPNQPAPDRLLRQERSTSALVWYWGMQGHHHKLGLHNIFFSKDYRAEFSSLFNGRNIPDDPTVYVHLSSRAERNDAPEDGENWFVMVNAPSDAGQRWDEIQHRCRQVVTDKLSRMLQTDVEDRIACEQTWTPSGIASDTLSHAGALYGTSSNSMFSAFLRHPNFTSRVKNLYFCGGTVHPGGGIPLVLLSARITTDIIRSRHEKP